jgi:glycosyltransferase involved in cell wall biosynthesis
VSQFSSQAEALPHIALISIHGDPAAEIGAEEAGGQNVYVREVGEALAQIGWTVDMFTRCIEAHQPRILEHSDRCRTIRLEAGPVTFVPRDEGFQYLPAYLDAFLAFQAKEGVAYPLVHSNYWLSSWVGMQLKRQVGAAQVHTYHSVGAVKYENIPDSDIPPIASKRLAVERECLETADRIVATSPQELEHLRSLVSQKGAIDIIPCGTDIRRFGQISQAEARQKLGIPADQKVIFYIGRFDPRKGIETLVQAIAQSTFREGDDLRLIIGGGYRPGQPDAEEHDRIVQLAEELGIAHLTTFPGRISDEDLPLYYAAASVCVVPSHYEPFGLVAIEAMASGTPVVASDVGGLQFTVVSEKTGLLATPQDERAFAKAIDRILADPDWRSQLGEAARQRVITEFSWQGVAQKLSYLYRNLLNI